MNEWKLRVPTLEPETVAWAITVVLPATCSGFDSQEGQTSYVAWFTRPTQTWEENE